MVMDQLKDTQVIYRGRYRFGMPWNVDLSTIQSNYKVAEKRSMLLQRKLLANEEFAQGYKKCMDKFLDHDFARELKKNEIDTASNGIWYIPHHAVVNEKKKKVRVVFDCAAKHNGKSLNDHVYQGPDLVSSLVGILLRFRMKPVALIADIESMYCRVRVKPEDEKMLRFLWWKDGNYDKE